MTSYKTPGVYIKEIDTFPPGVAAVETAIPAFIGYVERAEKDGESLIKLEGGQKVITPVRVKSLVDFELFFGKGAQVKNVKVSLSNDAAKKVESIEITPGFYLHNSMKLFFDNGGGDCFIVPVGLYKKEDGTDNTVDVADFIAGLDAIKKVDEPTLLVAPDGVLLDDGPRSTLQQQMLKQANDLQDRFAILDVKHNPNKKRFEIKEVDDFRQAIGASNLQYGAAYYPYVRTTYGLNFQYDQIALSQGGAGKTFAELSANAAFFTEVDNIFKDLGKDSMLNKLINAPYANGFTAPFDADPFKVSIAEGYDLIERTDNKAELTLRAQYIVEMLLEFIALHDMADFSDNKSLASKSLISPEAKSAFELHALKVDPAGDLKPLIEKLLIYDGGFPGDSSDALGEIADAADLDHNGLDYSGITVDLNDPDTVAILNSVYGDPPANPGDPVTDQVKKARPFFQQLYNDVLNQILDFREQLMRRAEGLEQFLLDNDPLYQRVNAAIRTYGVVLPPSGGVAGMYAYVDSNKGVWKAPANESLSSVMGPTIMIDSNDQMDINVDVNAGKSVNAIRAFRGRGTLVWGGRTLKGNDDNWRYVNVRRLFIFMEESIEKTMENFVFEPNTANTWIKVQTTIENFLTTIWRQGGLAGAKPEDAFQVSVGLGKTMSADDINKGLMIIDVMVAPSRPAEFIVLRFSQMQQVS